MRARKRLAGKNLSGYHRRQSLVWARRPSLKRGRRRGARVSARCPTEVAVWMSGKLICAVCASGLWEHLPVVGYRGRDLLYVRPSAMMTVCSVPGFEPGGFRDRGGTTRGSP